MVSKKRIKGEIKQEWIAEKKLYKKNGTLRHEQKEVASKLFQVCLQMIWLPMCPPQWKTRRLYLTTT